MWHEEKERIQGYGPKYNKNGLCEGVCVCVYVGIFAGLVAITRPWPSLDGLLNVSCGFTVGWYSPSASVCLSFFSFRKKKIELPSINTLKMKHCSGNTVKVKLAGQGTCVWKRRNTSHNQMPNIS